METVQHPLGIVQGNYAPDNCASHTYVILGRELQCFDAGHECPWTILCYVKDDLEELKKSLLELVKADPETVYRAAKYTEIFVSLPGFTVTPGDVLTDATITEFLDAQA